MCYDPLLLLLFVPCTFIMKPNKKGHPTTKPKTKKNEKKMGNWWGRKQNKYNIKILLLRHTFIALPISGLQSLPQRPEAAEESIL